MMLKVFVLGAFCAYLYSAFFSGDALLGNAAFGEVHPCHAALAHCQVVQVASADQMFAMLAVR